MNKKLFTLFAMMLITLTLVACGNNSGPKRDHLVFSVWGSSAEVANYEKIAKAYEEQGGMQVKVVPATGDYYDSLNISFSSKNNAPDLFFTESGEFIANLASSKIMNLQPYIDSGALDVATLSNTDGKIQLWDVNDAYRYDGEEIGKGDYYALIKDWSPDFILWYNKSHIDEYNSENSLNPGDAGYMEYPDKNIPMTWDEFLDMSYKLRKTNRYGTMLDRVPYKHLMEWIQMTGSSTWDSENKHFNANDPNVLKAFQFFVDLQVGPKASSPVVGPTGVGSGEAFANGNLSFAFFGNWAYSEYAWDSVGFEIGYCPSPVPAKTDGSELTAADTYAGSCGMVSLGIYKNTSNPDDAVDFLNFYMTYGNEYMASKGFNIPGNKKVANSETFMYPENSEVGAINRYFLNIANTYTHPIVYNNYINQLTFENIIGKYMSTYLSNPTGDTLQNVLNKIADDVKREV